MDAKQVMLAIAKEHGNDPERIANEWDQCQKIVSKLRYADQLASEEITRHKRAMKEINQRTQLVRSECPHWHRRHYGDPSGGTDRHSECDICGETWR